MKKIFSLLCLLVCLYTFGQNVEQQIKEIKTIEEAKRFIATHPNAESEILVIAPEIESPEITEIFLNKKIGDVFSKNNNTFKIIDSKIINSFRVSYIFLDGNKHSMETINNQRSQILQEYKNGTEFSTLAKQYTMDNSPNGDIGWFAEGMMIKEFETAIKSHKLNNIFTIDIPSEKWYYVTLKTFDDKEVKELTILRVKSNL